MFSPQLSSLILLIDDALSHTPLLRKHLLALLQMTLVDDLEPFLLFLNIFVPDHLSSLYFELQPLQVVLDFDVFTTA